MANYTITVDFKGGQGGDGYKSPKKGTREKEQLPEPTIGQQLDNKFDSIFDMLDNGSNAFGDVALVATLVEIGKDVFSHEVQKIGRYTGSQQAQSIANASLSLIGMIFNPIGSAINLAYEIDARAYQKEWENIGLTVARERAGTAINRSRTN